MNAPPDEVRSDLDMALAGAVLLRDAAAELGDTGLSTIGLATVAALSRVYDALAIDRPDGLAQMMSRDGGPPTPGFAAPQ